MWSMLMSLASAATFVQGSVAVVRALPEGAEVARLRIGTEVEVVEDRGDWSRVALLGWSEEHPVTGFVRRDLLGPRAPTLLQAVRRAEAATEVGEATRWAERAMALAPFDADARALRRGAAVAEGDLDLVALLDDVGSAPVYVARCSAGRALLVARVDDDGVHGMASLRAPEARALGRRLSGWAWYEAGATEPYLGSPFPAPFGTVVDNEDAASAYVPGQTTLGDPFTMKLVLGPCEGVGLLATHPLVVEEAGPLGDARQLLRRVVAGQVDPVLGAEVRQPVSGLPLCEVRLDALLHPRSCGGDGGERVVGSVYALVGPDGAPHVESHDGRWWLPRTDGPGSWVRIGDRFLGVYWDSGNTGESVDLHLWDGVLSSTFVMMSFYGC